MLKRKLKMLNCLDSIKYPKLKLKMKTKNVTWKWKTTTVIT